MDVTQANELLKETVGILRENKLFKYRGFTVEQKVKPEGSKEMEYLVKDKHGSDAGVIRKFKEGRGEKTPWQMFAMVPGVKGQTKMLGSFYGRSGIRKAIDALLKYRG